MESWSYKPDQEYLGLYPSVFDISYAEYIKDIYADKEEQQECSYGIFTVTVYMICFPGIYCFIKALVFNLPPAVADAYSIF